MPAKQVAIAFDRRVYRVAPTLKLVCEIEDEMGAVPALAARLAGEEWSVTELVTLIHIMLNAGGATVDWAVLGEVVVAEGTARYAASAREFLRAVTGE